MADQAIAPSLPAEQAPETYGLRAGALGPWEALAQSVSATSPSTGAALTIPLVYGVAGNASWLVYVLATAAVLLVGFCVSRFARLSASPGSLYTFAAGSLRPVFGSIAAWALLLAYVATGASVAGGASYYASVLIQQFFHWTPPAVPLLAVVCGASAWVAWRDVKLSAQMMLWIEAVSISMISLVLVLLIARFGWRIDPDQLRLRGADAGALGPALVLAIFTFVGFESATALGAEARTPLKTIPRAVMQCALLSGVFFIFCSYAEVLGFHGNAGAFSQDASPLHLLAARAAMPALGVGMDIGALISLFACVLACTTAAARVLLRMAHDGMIPGVLRQAHERHATPGRGVLVSAGIMFIATAAMAQRGVTGFDMYDLAGSLAVFGFLTAYGLVAIALPFARRSRGGVSAGVAAASIATVVVVILVAVYDLRSTSDAAHARIPWIYLAYISAGIAAYAFQQIGRRRRA